MDASLAAYLSGQDPAARGSVVWGKGGEERWPLDIAAYLTEQYPPLDYVTSVRALVLRDDKLLAMEDEYGLHILPGGRRERGEAPEAALRREVLEESGWTLRLGPVLGILHFRHRGPRPAPPPGAPYRYPFPDFLQLVYQAEADAYDPARLLPNATEQEAFQLLPIDTLPLGRLHGGERAFLAAALAQRHRLDCRQGC